MLYSKGSSAAQNLPAYMLKHCRKPKGSDLRVDYCLVLASITCTCRGFAVAPSIQSFYCQGASSSGDGTTAKQRLVLNSLR